MIIVSLVIMIFLWHIPSAVVPIVTIPISVLLSFIPLYFMGVTINIMSLAGIAISIGVLVDGAIVEVENAYNKIQRWQAAGGKGDFHAVRLEALMEVGPSVFFSLLVIAVAFLPIFVLVDQEGRLFKPLAYSKNLAMGLAAVLAVTLDPALRMLFARIEPFTFRPRFLAKLATTALVGTYHPEERHPISRTIFRIYDPACRFVLRHPKAVIGAAFGLVLVSLPMYFRLGSEFMPPLNEGTILYMPTTLPGISVAQAQELLIAQDKVLASYPEVERVFGKAGRADTSTDPAPFSMMETTVVLKPPDQWRGKERWYSSWAPGWVKAAAAPDLAGPHLLGRADRRHGREDALSRQHQRLDDADQGAHRHALDRHAHPRGHQDLRGRPRRDPEDRRAARGDRRRRSRAPAASSPSASPAATSWTSSRSATRSPATG